MPVAIGVAHETLIVARDRDPRRNNWSFEGEMDGSARQIAEDE